MNKTEEFSIKNMLDKLFLESHNISTDINEVNKTIIDAFSKVYVSEGFKSAEEIQSLENILRINVAEEAMDTASQAVAAFLCLRHPLCPQCRC